MIKSRMIRWATHVVHMGMKRTVYKVLVGKPEGDIIWEEISVDRDNIKIDFNEVGQVGVDWIHLAQDKGLWHASVNMVMNLHVHVLS
jgi:hypothetical protein